MDNGGFPCIILAPKCIVGRIEHEADNKGIACAVTIGGAYMSELVENFKWVPLWIIYGDSDYNMEEYTKKMVAELNGVGGINDVHS